jgi:hypothetical protein
MASRINKALDLNKLFEDHKVGKRVKTIPTFPMLTSVKFDGNYVVVIVDTKTISFFTSGGHEYKHTDSAADIFMFAKNGIYLAERISGKGILGDRFNCNLHGPKTVPQLSTGHTYRVFDMLTIEEYEAGKASQSLKHRHCELLKSGISDTSIVQYRHIFTQEEFDTALEKVTSKGYEGLMGASPDWIWEHHKTRRKTNFVKYKKRPTADLRCIGVKYSPINPEDIGSLECIDSEGRVCFAGAIGDENKKQSPDYFIGRIVEVEYEHIKDTYIQPFFVSFRDDKSQED